MTEFLWIAMCYFVTNLTAIVYLYFRDEGFSARMSIWATVMTMLSGVLVGLWDSHKQRQARRILNRHNDDQWR